MKTIHRLTLKLGICGGLLGLVVFFTNCAQTSDSGSSGGGGHQGQGVSYYVDSTLGSDANSGSSSDSPWKTLAKVSSSTFSNGTVIYLKRGQIWYEELQIPSSGVTIDAYGSGGLPQINGSMSVSSWTSEGSGIYSKIVTLAAGEALGNISENGVMMKPLDWRSNPTTTFSGAAVGTYSFDNGLKKIFIKPATAPSGNAYLASRKLYGVSAIGKSNITVKNLSITRFSLNGINFQECSNCSVYTVSITNGGGVASGLNPSGPPDYIYAGNGIEYDKNSSGGVVDGVTISDIFDSCISPQTYANNELTENLQFKNSNLSLCGFAGIEISILSNGGTTGSQIRNITASGMTITNSGKGWSGRRYGTEGHGVRVQADSGAGSMSGVTIDTSTISGSAGSGVKLGGNISEVTLSRLKIKGNAYGVDVQVAGNSSLMLSLSSSLIYGNGNYGLMFNAPLSAGLKIYHNTFYNNTAINLAIFGQSGLAKIQNNIFYSSAAMTHLYSTTPLAGVTINNNCYNNLSNMFGYNGVAYSSVAAFQSGLGFESGGLGGNVNMVNPAGEDFSLQASSQCRGLGASGLGVSQDYIGKSYALPPSSGAFEF